MTRIMGHFGSRSQNWYRVTHSIGTDRSGGATLFKPKTLFIIGAGASIDFGMPLGTDLAAQMQSGARFEFDHGGQLVSGDKAAYWALRRHYPKNEDLNLVLRGMREISNGIVTADSIDTFIDRYEHDDGVRQAGKFLIAYYILKAERASLLKHRRDGQFDDYALNLGSLSKLWVTPFRSMLFSDLKKAGPTKLSDSLRVISFNYDRCLERFLQEAFRQGFGQTTQEAAEIVRSLDIFHPYGSLGRLPPADFGTGAGEVAFGQALDEVDLRAISAGLLTFTEQLNSRDMERCGQMVGWAERIVFLGFGFHPANMRLLGSAFPHSPDIYSTGIGISQQEREVLIGECLRMVGLAPNHPARSKVHIETDLNCTDLLTVHRRNLLEFVSPGLN